MDRACEFYQQVLAIEVKKEKFDKFEFAVFEHAEGNGGCLVPNPADVSDKGLMLYLNVDGRIADAETKVTQFGGTILQATHAIGPHGCRCIILDSEGNRIVLHSTTA
ncbi:hypothetical protein JQC92_04500 [Shewanella sp. 202IG2-18]|uniref:VOC family protein n=1 Tax=Parashewanella hymeniacidonis TaxID=2807618 RepID=UPI0019602974|nr:VOC family protein [Parashewanella hymeniacidonis]MBM7071302.1 hypothetical protein [Parashewanella hymeniacidonis]